MLPNAMAAEAAIAPDVLRLTRKAPTVTAGHVRMPNMSRAATAIPVGGHTALALAFTNANERPSRPARKYTAVNRPSSERYRR